MSKLVAAASTLALLVLTACEGSPSAPGVDNAQPEPTSAAAVSDLSSASCDQNELFVKQGLAQDMRDTLGAAFVKDYQIRVPGALIAYDSYGGDMIQTILGASASAAQVFAVNPGGPFSGQVGGSAGNSSKLSTRGLVAAKALFDAIGFGMVALVVLMQWLRRDPAPA